MERKNYKIEISQSLYNFLDEIGGRNRDKERNRYQTNVELAYQLTSFVGLLFLVQPTNPLIDSQLTLIDTRELDYSLPIKVKGVPKYKQNQRKIVKLNLPAHKSTREAHILLGNDLYPSNIPDGIFANLASRFPFLFKDDEVEGLKITSLIGATLFYYAQIKEESIELSTNPEDSSSDKVVIEPGLIFQIKSQVKI